MDQILPNTTTQPQILDNQALSLTPQKLWYEKIKDKLPSKEELEINPEWFTPPPLVNNEIAPSGPVGYSTELKINVCICYTYCGNLYKTAKIFDISPQTITNWKQKSSWWKQVSKEAKRALNESLEANFTEMMHKGAEQMLERLETGNPVVTDKGLIINRDLTSQELAEQYVRLPFDKRNTMRNEFVPPEQKSKESIEDYLKKLSSSFEKLAKKVPKSIENITETVLKDGVYTVVEAPKSI